MTPQSRGSAVPFPRALVRRSAIGVGALLLIVGAPLVATAVGTDMAEGADPTPTAARAIADFEVAAPTPTIPELGTDLDTTPRSETTPPEPPVEATKEVATDEAPVEVTPEPTVPAGTDPDQWAALRDCESNGNYAIVSRSGKYRGAYQFGESTWNSVAERHAPQLVGVDPAAASPADQDVLAFALYVERGAQPWPLCGRHLP